MAIIICLKGYTLKNLASRWSLVSRIYKVNVPCNSSPGLGPKSTRGGILTRLSEQCYCRQWPLTSLMIRKMLLLDLKICKNCFYLPILFIINIWLFLLFLLSKQKMWTINIYKKSFFLEEGDFLNTKFTLEGKLCSICFSCFICCLEF